MTLLVPNLQLCLCWSITSGTRSSFWVIVIPFTGVVQSGRCLTCETCGPGCYDPGQCGWWVSCYREPSCLWLETADCGRTSSPSLAAPWFPSAGPAHTGTQTHTERHTHAHKLLKKICIVKRIENIRIFFILFTHTLVQSLKWKSVILPWHTDLCNSLCCCCFLGHWVIMGQAFVARPVDSVMVELAQVRFIGDYVCLYVVLFP